MRKHRLLVCLTAFALVVVAFAMSGVASSLNPRYKSLYMRARKLERMIGQGQSSLCESEHELENLVNQSGRSWKSLSEGRKNSAIAVGLLSAFSVAAMRDSIESWQIQYDEIMLELEVTPKFK